MGGRADRHGLRAARYRRTPGDPLYFHGPTPAWILGRYDDVRLALTHSAFTTRSYAAQTEPVLGKTIVQLDGREHAPQRGLLTPSFRSEDRDRFRTWYTALIRGALNLTGDAAVAVAATTARDALDAYLRPLITARRERPGTDLISTAAAGFSASGPCSRASRPRSP